jgi:hypothetical protein
MMRRSLACLALPLLLLPPALRAAPLVWPELELPSGGRAEVVAADTVLNGKRSRILKLSLPGTLDDALAFYRERFGKQHVVNSLRGSQVIAAKQGTFFQTVQLHAGALGHVEATVITTSLDSGDSRSAALQETQRGLPADSAVMQSMESRDGDRRSLMLTAANTVGLEANRDAVLQRLREHGLRVVREDKASPQGHPTLTLWAEGPHEEATITLVDAGRYRTVLINRVRGDQP